MATLNIFVLRILIIESEHISAEAMSIFRADDLALTFIFIFSIQLTSFDSILHYSII